MAYNSLTIGLADDLLTDLQMRVAQYDFSCTICTTIQEAGRLLNSQVFHLLIVDLEYLRSLRQIGWLAEIRRISFVPVIVLSDTPEEDIRGIIHLGADPCPCREIGTGGLTACPGMVKGLASPIFSTLLFCVSEMPASYLH